MGKPSESTASLLSRYANNPILTPGDWPYPVNAVFNPAAVRLESGETLLLCRVEDRAGLSHLCAARSANGETNWRIDPAPTLTADPARHPEEQWGIEDPRIVWLAELGRFAVIYTAYGKPGPAVSLALTRDFRSFERLGQILPPEDKDAALLPNKINGRWAMIHRPVTYGGERHIWMSFSPDLRHWGDRTLLMKARRGGWWDANKIGLCTPLVETPDGFLMIYHGVKQTVSGCIYRIGLALLDRNDPTRCVRRGVEWIFGPEADYERSGDVDDVAFPCGYTVGDDGDSFNLYYGAADTCIGLATGSIQQMLDWLKANGVEADHGTD